MTYSEIYKMAMPLAKQKKEKGNIWVALVVRPLSILLTMPLIQSSIKPITITKISVIACLLGFILYSLNLPIYIKILGWFFYFIWAILDGVDGNLARCTNQCSGLGELWDATGGYLAMICIYFSSGIAAYFENSIYSVCDNFLLLIIGGMTAIFAMFPRLILHKRKNSLDKDTASEKLSNKATFSVKEIFAMNIISASGFLQVILLLATLFHILNIFIIFYCIVNFLIMLLSLRRLLK